MNLWEYDIPSKKFTQLTHFTDYDVHYPSLGPQDIVFEQGGNLYLYSLSAKTYKQVPVQVVTDERALRPSLENSSKYLFNGNIAPDGKRALFEARGDIFSVPAENGPVIDLTRSSSVAERFPAWSPDGRHIAYWSDRSGEYELTLRDAGNTGSEKKLTSYGAGFRYNLFWSPDSKKIAFIDKAMKIYIYDLTSGQTTFVDQGLRMTEGALQGFSASWSPDSRFLTYDRDLLNAHRAVFIYDDAGKKLHSVTSGFYSCTNPVFDLTGKYLFITTNQSFRPLYSDLDNTFIYPNSTRLAAIVLEKTTRSPLYPKNDTVAFQKEQPAPAEHPTPPKTPPASAPKPAPAATTIDFDDLEARMILLPVDAGNYGSLSAVEGKLIYMRAPNTGSGERTQSLRFFDLDKRTTKTIVDDLNGYTLAADNKHLLVTKDGSWYIIGADEGQKLDKKLRTTEMQQWVTPREEWRQILVDAWRLERDYFYDSAMHGVDWTAGKRKISQTRGRRLHPRRGGFHHRRDDR